MNAMPQKPSCFFCLRNIFILQRISEAEIFREYAEHFLVISVPVNSPVCHNLMIYSACNSDNLTLSSLRFSVGWHKIIPKEMKCVASALLWDLDGGHTIVERRFSNRFNIIQLIKLLKPLCLTMQKFRIIVSPFIPLELFC